MDLLILFWICAAVVMLVVYPYFVINHKNEKHYLYFSLIKGLGTVIIALPALFAALTAASPVVWLIFAGILVCAVADFILRYQFIPGMFVFLVGHLIFLTAFFFTGPFHWASIVVFLILFIAVLGYFYRGICKMGLQSLPYILYCGALLFMVAVAAFLPASAGRAGVFMALGAVLFAVSDLFIAKSIIYQPLKYQDYWVMGIYYSALLSLAFSATCFN